MKNITVYKPYIKTFTLLCAFGLLLSYQFIGAQWTNPPAGPPNNNVDAPINVGSTAQVKSGNMGANIVSAISQTWSPEYCDENGNNCTAATSLSGSGSSLPTCTDGQVLKYTGGSWQCGQDVSGGSASCTLTTSVVSACKYPSGDMSNAVSCPAGTVATGPAYQSSSCSTNNYTYKRDCIAITCS